jgi:hypothetical protein
VVARPLSYMARQQRRCLLLLRGDRLIVLLWLVLPADDLDHGHLLYDRFLVSNQLQAGGRHDHVPSGVTRARILPSQ